MKIQTSLFVAALAAKSIVCQAQLSLQTIKGKVVDSQSHYPLEGATIQLIGTSMGTLSRQDGSFIMPGVVVGRVSLKITFVGYGEAMLTNIQVGAGKETDMAVELTETITHVNAVVVGLSDEQRHALNNELATVSAHGFTVSDTRRFAGSRNDPARMASNVAGVMSNSDFRNDIIIRGNSPLGLLWRLEDIDIPNPNHFGGGTGGPVSMLNNNVLAKSDFMTGAFPAQYGNALSGVFDLRLRQGNATKREFVAQMGLNGFEFGVEGGMGKAGASYLLNYRYSAFALLQKVGFRAGLGTMVPYFQDLNANLRIPLKNGSALRLLGLTGRSTISIDPADFAGNSVQSGETIGLQNASGSWVAGLTYEHFFDPRTSGKLTLFATGRGENTATDSLNVQQNRFLLAYQNTIAEHKTGIRYAINKKLSATDLVRAGLTYTRLQFSYIDSVRSVNRTNQFALLHQAGGATELWQAFAEWQHRFSGKLTLNMGLYWQRFGINANSQALEPRLGVRYQLTDHQFLNVGVGRHSQGQSLDRYFLQTTGQDGKTWRSNLGLGLTRSTHYVISYNNYFAHHWSVKIEPYIQLLNYVPIQQRPTFYSALNEGATYGLVLEDSLVNRGVGKNYGIEFTLEKGFSQGLYLLWTTSLYKSTYKGSNGIEKNTAFNGNYVVNLLAGRECKLSDWRLVAFDLKIILAGGRRYVPINIPASINAHTAVYDYEHAYESQFKAYSRFDAKLTYRVNAKKTMQEWYVDVQNIFNTKNIFSQSYNSQAASVNTQYQFGIYPVLNYRILF